MNFLEWFQSWFAPAPYWHAPLPMPTPHDPTQVEAMIKLLSLHNKLRATRGLPPLKLNSWLSEAAAIQAVDMAQHDRLTHTGSDGSTVGDRVTRVGYHWSYVEANAAEQPYAPGFPTDMRTEEEAMTGWENSPGHLKNILSPIVTEMGAAYCDAAPRLGEPAGTRFWSVVFARPAQ